MTLKARTNLRWQTRVYPAAARHIKGAPNMASMTSGTSVMGVVYEVSASRGWCYGVFQVVESREAFEMESGRLLLVTAEAWGGCAVQQFARPTSVEADLTQKGLHCASRQYSKNSLPWVCLESISIWWFQRFSDRSWFEGMF